MLIAKVTLCDIYHTCGTVQRLLSSGTLRDVGRWLLTDVSGGSSVMVTFLRIRWKMILEDGADKMCRNVDKQQQVLRNAPEERRL